VSRYRYPLSMQLSLPADYRGDQVLRSRLRALEAAGFSGVELNIIDPETVNPADLSAFLADHGLPLVAFATGGAARAHGLSLSDPDPARRRRSIDRALSFIEFGARCGADVIAGYLQGPPGADPAVLRPLFRESLAALQGAAADARVRFVVEAVTRFYSPVANTLDQAWDFIRPFGNPWLRIMPDTFNMNIEERDGRRALREHLGRYDAVHLSDNNRLFPGHGAIDFPLLIGFLGEVGFRGRLGIEGEIARSFDEDLATCMRVLAPALAR
jgi:D-psicose/D-tagatose/L-ribulose 3-epimerase